MSAERLQKVLASAGVASRRDCEELIASGRVTVNGRVMHELGARVDPTVDAIELDGKPIQQPSERAYVLLHKPVGVVSTADDPQGRPTVVELVNSATRLFPVGRLDTDSEGLLLLTDDGELTHRLTHPSFEVEKEYRALLDQAPSAEALRQWREGVTLEGERTAPAWVEVQEPGEGGTWVRVVLREGRKRQIREVAKLLGYEVLRLIRVREDTLQLGDLPAGAWRSLTPEEVATLQAHTATIARTTSRLTNSRREGSNDSEGEQERPARSGEREFRPRTPYGRREETGDREDRGDSRDGDLRDRVPRDSGPRNSRDSGPRDDRSSGPRDSRDSGPRERSPRDDRAPRESTARRDEGGFRSDRSSGPRDDRGSPRDDRSSGPRDSRDSGPRERSPRDYGARRDEGGFRSGSSRDDRGGFRSDRGSSSRDQRDDRGGYRGDRSSSGGFRSDRGSNGGFGDSGRRDDRSSGGFRSSGPGAPRDDRSGFRSDRNSSLRSGLGSSSRRNERGSSSGFRNDRGSSGPGAPRDDRGGFRSDRSNGPGAPRDDRGGFRSDRSNGPGAPRDDRGGFRSDRSGGGFGSSGRRDDRSSGGYRDDRGSGGFRSGGGFGSSGRRDDRSGGFGNGGRRDDRGSGGFRSDRGSSGPGAPRDDRGGYRDDRGNGPGAPRDDRGSSSGFRERREERPDRSGRDENSSPPERDTSFRERSDSRPERQDRRSSPPPREAETPRTPSRVASTNDAPPPNRPSASDGPGDQDRRMRVAGRGARIARGTFRSRIAGRPAFPTRSRPAQSEDDDA